MRERIRREPDEDEGEDERHDEDDRKRDEKGETREQQAHDHPHERRRLLGFRPHLDQRTASVTSGWTPDLLTYPAHEMSG